MLDPRWLPQLATDYILPIDQLDADFGDDNSFFCGGIGVRILFLVMSNCTKRMLI